MAYSIQSKLYQNIIDTDNFTYDIAISYDNRLHFSKEKTQIEQKNNSSRPEKVHKRFQPGLSEVQAECLRPDCLAPREQ